VQAVADRRQRDVHDGHVDDDHDLGGDHQAEHRPRAAGFVVPLR